MLEKTTCSKKRHVVHVWLHEQRKGSIQVPAIYMMYSTGIYNRPVGDGIKENYIIEFIGGNLVLLETGFAYYNAIDPPSHILE